MNVKATLSGQTVYLEKSPMVVVKAFPSNRIYRDTYNNNANIGILKIYDINKNLVTTSSPFTLNSAGTGTVSIDAPA
jgi:hypothetical protein